LPWLVLAGSIALAAPPSAPATEPEGPAPVVIALDSSRSLSAAQSAAAVALAGDLAGRLGAGAPVAILTFDDEVRWLATAPGDAATALAGVSPRGRFTLLHDGLVEAIRTLGAGGALLVVTDGRDENSATTLEDVARLASAAGVRILTVGAGRADERALRRLALLTGGAHLGALDAADGAQVASEVGRVQELIADERRARRLTAAEAAPAPALAAPTPVPAPAPSSAANFWVLALLAAAVAGVLGFWLARRGAKSGPETEELPEVGTAPGIPMPVAPRVAAPLAATAPPVDEDLVDELRGRPVVPSGGLFEVSFDDTAAFQSLPRLDPFERTLVLTEETVLSVREHGHETRSFRLAPQHAVSIGRDAQRNTLSFQDPTLSSQHFRVVLADGVAYLIDLESTNGVYLREERVRSARLHPGDRFRAGLLEFELQVRQQSLT
jgi:hypothetical protein